MELSDKQKRYDELSRELEPWLESEYDPDDPRNAEMQRKSKEHTLLFYQLSPDHDPGWDKLTIDDMH